MQELADGHVEITPMDFVPGARVIHYRDRLALMLVKETYGVNEVGGMGAFCHSALIEAQVRRVGGACACVCADRGPDLGSGAVCDAD